MYRFFRILFYLLAILIPLNNLIVQYTTKILNISEYYSSWKEIIIFVLMSGLIVLIIQDFKFILKKSPKLLLQKIHSFKFSNSKTILINFIKLLWPLILVILLSILSLISSFAINNTSLKVYAFGYLFELWWLNFFAITLNWWLLATKKFEFLSKQEKDMISLNNSKFYKGLTTSILLGFGLVCIISISSLILGPLKTLTPFGYGVGSTNSEFISTTPICHGVDPALPECRLMASFTQPVHYAGYLLFIVAFLAVLIYKEDKIWRKILYLLLLLMSVYFIYQSYTRYALLGLGVILSGIVLHYLAAKKDISLRFAKILTGVILIIPLVISIYFINLDPKIATLYLPASLTKEQSTDQHYRHAANSFNIVEKSVDKIFFGYGMGSTGSATREKYQDIKNNPIVQRLYGSQNFWQLSENRFVMTENWFVQTLLNGGVLYFLIYLFLILVPFFSIFELFKSKVYSESLFLEVLLSLGFFGIILGNLFQHLWENQTLTIYWTILWLWGKLLLAQINKTKKQKNVDTLNHSF